MQKVVNKPQQIRMLSIADAAEIRNTAHIPQQSNRQTIRRTRCNFGILAHGLQRHQVVRITRLGQRLMIWRFLKRPNQPIDRTELQRVIAPNQLLKRRKPVIHDRACDLIRQCRRIPGDTKGAVLLPAPSAPRDLCQFIGRQRPHPTAIKFRQAGKGNVINIKVQPHPNRIRRDQKINLAFLIHRHLRIARARRQRPHHNRRTAPLTPNKFRNRIDVFNGKPDNRRPWTHPADLLLPRISQIAHAITRQKIGLGHKRGDGPPHGRCPQKQRFMQPTCAQQPICEHMAPFRISA